MLYAFLVLSKDGCEQSGLRPDRLTLGDDMPAPIVGPRADLKIKGLLTC